VGADGGIGDQSRLPNDTLVLVEWIGWDLVRELAHGIYDPAA
jgi:hypothetical protein